MADKILEKLNELLKVLKEDELSQTQKKKLVKQIRAEIRKLKKQKVELAEQELADLDEEFENEEIPEIPHRRELEIEA